MSSYQHNQDVHREPECGPQVDAMSYDVCLAKKAYRSNRKGAEQRPFDWRSRVALARSSLTLAALERDTDRANETTRLHREVAELDPHAWWRREELESHGRRRWRSVQGLDGTYEWQASAGVCRARGG